MASMHDGVGNLPAPPLQILYPIHDNFVKGGQGTPIGTNVGMKRKSRKRKSGGKWIQRAIKRPGAFRAKAKARGMSTMQFARKVLSNPSAYDKRTVRQARLAVTLSNLRKK